MSILQAAILAVGLTDDDSVLMPSPPPDFTPALASVVMEQVVVMRPLPWVDHLAASGAGDGVGLAPELSSRSLEGWPRIPARRASSRVARPRPSCAGNGVRGTGRATGIRKGYQ